MQQTMNVMFQRLWLQFFVTSHIFWFHSIVFFWNAKETLLKSNWNSAFVFHLKPIRQNNTIDKVWFKTFEAQNWIKKVKSQKKIKEFERNESALNKQNRRRFKIICISSLPWKEIFRAREKIPTVSICIPTKPRGEAFDRANGIFRWHRKQGGPTRNSIKAKPLANALHCLCVLNSTYIF